MGMVEEVAEAIKRMVAKLLFGKSFDNYEEIMISHSIEEEVLLITLKRLAFEGKVNEAEDMLFDNAKNSKVENLPYVVIEFYTMLMNKSDEEFKEFKFSKEEIYDGIEDIKKYIIKN
ncbi:DUF6483 family protein [[Clostridium] dakarense]|uniref:DUF6483 family protein n=1 Tax=Faecalimicrobium dakarense TaxID=1301100 RepID=UPI0004B4EDE5|nr:DUF6483 family protein [[Clostridium] dakarense]